MLMRMLALALGLGMLSLTTSEVIASAAKNKAALQELQSFVGSWKGSGSTKLVPGPKDKFWEEKISWGWKFKGDDCWMTVTFAGGKFLEKAELRYLADKKNYQLTGTTPEGKKLSFEGKLEDDKLVLERTDPATKDIQRIRINTAAEGIRLIYIVERKTKGSSLWRPEFASQQTKEGESLARTEKGPECVVSGGRGTSTVSYMGETFYICCSGCADAFRENPKKYVDEFKAKKKKK
ncbi:MAG: YHS domain-containing protein [Gemmataceae bacterium]